MSVHVMSWVLRHSEEKLGNRLVLLVLADYASDDGARAFPKIDTIAADARLSRSQVIRCLKSLAENGSILEMGKRASGTKEYRVIMGSHIATPGVASTTPEEEQGSHPATAEVAIRDLIHQEPPVRHEPSKTLAAISAANSYDPKKGMKIEGRNIPWDVLVEVTHADETVEAGQIARALKLIRGYVVDASSAQTFIAVHTGETHIAMQIRSRARLYRQRWPQMELTPTALAKNWSRVLTDAPGGSPDTALDAAQRGIDAARRTT